MPLYKSWDVKRETRKAVAAGSFEEFAKAGELFLLVEYQKFNLTCTASVFKEGTIIFSLTDLFKAYNACYSDLCFILGVKLLTFCYNNTKGVFVLGILNNVK